MAAMNKSRLPTLGRTALAGAAFCAAATPVFAQDAVIVVAQANPCAIYGSGFVPIQGASTCARIGGRVRLESEATSGARAASAPSPLGAASLGYAPDETAGRAHLRAAPLPGGNAPRIR